jgi:methionine-rich copper-binding protein CopC
MRNPMFKHSSLAAITLSLLNVSPTVAFAHAELKTSNPAADSSVVDVQEIRMGFNEGINPKFSGADLKDETGKAVATGSAKVDAKNKKELIVPVSAKLSPGSYTVEWHAVSEDSHRVKGRFSFKVTP